MNGHVPPVDLLRQSVSAWNEWRRQHSASPIALQGIDLYDADLSEVDLSLADLTDARLAGVNLNAANLAGATFTRADLTYANLTVANLSTADLADAQLAYADLTGADLVDATLIRASLPRAKLTHAVATGAILKSATLTRAVLASAQLTRANLIDADLTGANLTTAELAYASFSGANLTDADLTRANLTHATFTRAILTRTILARADLTNAYVTLRELRSARLDDLFLVKGTRPIIAKQTSSDEPQKHPTFPELPPGPFAAVRITIPNAPKEVSPSRIEVLVGGVTALCRVASVAATDVRSDPVSSGGVAVATGSPVVPEIAVRRLTYGSPWVVDLLEYVKDFGPHAGGAYLAVDAAIRRDRSFLVNVILKLCRKEERDNYFRSRSVRSETDLIRAETEREDARKELAEAQDRRMKSEARMILQSTLDVRSATIEELQTRVQHADEASRTQEALADELLHIAPLFERDATITVVTERDQQEPSGNL